MIPRRKRTIEDGAGELRALRSVLRETGLAKVAEVFRLFDVDETSQFLRLSKKTVRNMTYRRELPCVKVGRRGVRYRLIDLLSWCEERKQPAQH